MKDRQHKGFSMKNGLKVDVKRSLATARAAVAALVMALSVMACGDKGDPSRDDLLALLNNKLPTTTINLDKDAAYRELLKEFNKTLADNDKAADIDAYLAILNIRNATKTADIQNNGKGKDVLTLSGLDAAKAGEGVDDYYNKLIAELQVINDDFLVRLGNNNHNLAVGVDVYTWGLTNKERDDLIVELQRTFEGLGPQTIGRLDDNKIMEFGIVNGLKPSAEWYTGFHKGFKESGMHIAYFPPEDIKSMSSIISSVRLDVQDPNVALPRIPNDWIDGVPPSNAGRTAVGLRAYEAAQESKAW